MYRDMMGLQHIGAIVLCNACKDVLFLFASFKLLPKI